MRRNFLLIPVILLVLFSAVLLSGCVQPGSGPGLGSGQARTLYAENDEWGLGLVMPNRRPAWSDDSSTIIFPVMGPYNSIWAVDIEGGKPWELTAHSAEIREGDFPFGKEGGSTPVNDPKSDRIVYYAYAKLGLVGEHAVLESISLNGDGPEFYAKIEAPAGLVGFEMSPDGMMIMAPGGYLIRDVTPGSGKILPAEKAVTGGLGGFTSDSRAFIYKHGDEIYRYDIESGSGELLMEAECYGIDYCARDNLAACTIAVETGCTPIVVYDLDTKEKRQVDCYRAASDLKWSPECSMIAYRAHQQPQGAMLRVVGVGQ